MQWSTHENGGIPSIPSIPLASKGTHMIDQRIRAGRMEPPDLCIYGCKVLCKASLQGIFRKIRRYFGVKYLEPKPESCKSSGLRARFDKAKPSTGIINQTTSSRQGSVLVEPLTLIHFGDHHHFCQMSSVKNLHVRELYWDETKLRPRK